MRKLFVIILLSVVSAVSAQKTIYTHAFAPSEGLVNRLERPCRSELCLNGYWEFQPIALPADFAHGKVVAPALPLPRDNAWDATRIKIPSPWNVNEFGFNGLEGPDHRNYPSYPKAWEKTKMAWMRKRVQIPADWKGRRILLHFEAVAGMTEVYVDRRKVGENVDLFLPFALDVTDHVTPGEEAEILVGVRSQWLFEDNATVGRRVVPAGSMWGYTINGIWQDVYLQALPQVYVKDVFVKPLVGQRVLQVELTVANSADRRAALTVEGTVD